MNFKSLTEHPDQEEIVNRLINGVSAKDLNQWLKLKYPKKEQKHLILSIKLIEEYANQNVGNLMAHLQKDFSNLVSEEEEEKIAPSLLDNRTYRERMVELVDQELDIKKEIKNLILMIRIRVEQVFDKIQEDPRNLGKGDYILINWFDTLLNAVEKFDKIHNGAPDHIIQHNVSIQMVDKTKLAIVEAVRKTLAHLDAEASMMFIEYVSKELQTLETPQELIMTPETRTNQAELLYKMTPILEEKLKLDLYQAEMDVK